MRFLIRPRVAEKRVTKAKRMTERVSPTKPMVFRIAEFFRDSDKIIIARKIPNKPRKRKRTPTSRGSSIGFLAFWRPFYRF